MNMKIVRLLAATALFAMAASGQPSAAAARGRIVREGPVPEPSGGQREVLMVSAGCGTDYISLDFKATGQAVEGLQRAFTPGSSNFLYFTAEDCPSAITEIRNLMDERRCATRSGASVDSLASVCLDDRNAIIGVVGRVLEIAILAAPGN